MIFYLFFFNDTATTEIYTLSLHDALPISVRFHSSRSSGTGAPSTQNSGASNTFKPNVVVRKSSDRRARSGRPTRSEEHTSELQSQSNLVCRLLLEKKKSKNYTEAM